MRRLFYSGDRNIEYGGYFYSLDGWQWDYVSAVRVTPCSDAGGPDNCFWVERLTVNIRDGLQLDWVMGCVGLDREQLRKLSRAQKRHALIDAHIAYGAFDTEHSEMIQIGKEQDKFHSGDIYIPTKVLRGNASLRRYVRSMAREHC